MTDPYWRLDGWHITAGRTQPDGNLKPCWRWRRPKRCPHCDGLLYDFTPPLATSIRLAATHGAAQ